LPILPQTLSICRRTASRPGTLPFPPPFG
jgi:hypothetical protein